MPPATAVLLDAVARAPGRRTASGVFNTSRQVGGALAIAVFGALLADRAPSWRGVAHEPASSPLGVLAVTTTLASLRLPKP